MRHCLARLIQLLIFASIRPAIQPMPRRPPFTDSMPDDCATKILLAHTKRVDAPPLPEQGPDLISYTVTMDDATFIT